MSPGSAQGQVQPGGRPEGGAQAAELSSGEQPRAGYFPKTRMSTFSQSQSRGGSYTRTPGNWTSLVTAVTDEYGRNDSVFQDQGIKGGRVSSRHSVFGDACFWNLPPCCKEAQASPRGPPPGKELVTGHMSRGRESTPSNVQIVPKETHGAACPQLMPHPRRPMDKINDC